MESAGNPLSGDQRNAESPVMVKIKCPKCKSEIEIEDYKKDEENRTAVFCKNEECFFHKNPIVGLDRKEPGVYISETLL